MNEEMNDDEEFREAKLGSCFVCCWVARNGLLDCRAMHRKCAVAETTQLSSSNPSVLRYRDISSIIGRLA